MSRPNWHLVDNRPCETWQHDTLPVWCVHYQATNPIAAHWQAYTTKLAPQARRPLWSQDNHRLGREGMGYATLAEAQAFAERAVTEGAQ